ncbi:MAG: hypothetical protein PHG00_16030, partial [Methylococcales bacterium]|nr:hypothetical protein [Methylococcales bacterium]
GYELIYDFPQPTPMILTLSVHYTRISDMILQDHLITDPPVPIPAYRDSYGNLCSPVAQANCFSRPRTKNAQAI